MTATVTFGVFLWTDDASSDSTQTKSVNQLQLGHRDDPSEMPDEYRSYAKKNDVEGYDDLFVRLQEITHKVIGHEDRYGDLQELPNVESGYYRKLGEITFAEGDVFGEYDDSPPSYEDTDGDLLVHLKPKYANWRQLAV